MLTLLETTSARVRQATTQYLSLQWLSWAVLCCIGESMSVYFRSWSSRALPGFQNCPVATIAVEFSPKGFYPATSIRKEQTLKLLKPTTVIKGQLRVLASFILIHGGFICVKHSSHRGRRFDISDVDVGKTRGRLGSKKNLFFCVFIGQAILIGMNRDCISIWCLVLVLAGVGGGLAEFGGAATLGGNEIVLMLKTHFIIKKITQSKWLTLVAITSGWFVFIIVIMKTSYPWEAERWILVCQHQQFHFNYFLLFIYPQSGGQLKQGLQVEQEVARDATHASKLCAFKVSPCLFSV